MTDLLGTPSAEAIARVWILWLCYFILHLQTENFVYLLILLVACNSNLFTLFRQIRNEKARRYLSSMRKKKPISFSHKFPNADPLALRLLEKMLAFDPKDRPSAEEVFYTYMSLFLFHIGLCLFNIYHDF